jgi:hypothetical protein
MTLRHVMRHGRRIAVETLDLGSGPSKARRQQGLFIKVPLQWAAVASKATKTPKAFIWLLLLHLAWRTKNTTFSFSNEMLRRYYRVSPQTKRRALEELEAAGQISIKRQNGRAPIITLIGHLTA